MFNRIRSAFVVSLLATQLIFSSVAVGADPFYSATIVMNSTGPFVIQPSDPQFYPVPVTVTNTSTSTWPVACNTAFPHPCAVLLTYHLYNKNGSRLVSFVNLFTRLGATPMASGESRVLDLLIDRSNPVQLKPGSYVVSLDLVGAGPDSGNYTWFSQQGNTFPSSTWPGLLTATGRARPRAALREATSRN